MKGQFWSFDIIFAIVIFVLAVAILTYVWANISNQLSLASTNTAGTLQQQLQNLEVRLFSQGTPSNWNSLVNVTNTSTWQNISVGLGTGLSGSLSSPKVYTLMAMSNQNYSATKSVMGVGYDYYITIKGGGINVTMGTNPNPNSPQSVQSLTVPVAISGRQASMQIYLWTNTSGVE